MYPIWVSYVRTRFGYYYALNLTHRRHGGYDLPPAEAVQLPTVVLHDTLFGYVEGLFPVVASAALPGQPAEKKRARFAKCDEAWLSMDLTARELRVLLALSLHANWTEFGHGRCFPKRDTLALTTKLQISHISEAVRALSQKHGLITVVRLGRKNIYYVRAIGRTERMPPSDADPFFNYLGTLGIKLALTDDDQLTYMPNSKKLENFDTLLRAILSDYARGLVPRKIQAALHVNQTAKESILI